MTIANKTIEKIKKTNVKPRTVLYFWTKEWFFWTLVVVCTILVALSFAVSVYLMVNHEWQLYFASDESWYKQMLIVVPYFWAVLLVLFLLLTCYTYRQTKKGYIRSTSIVVLLIAIVSVSFGLVLHTTGVGERVDRAMYDRVPQYRPLVKRGVHMWQRPGQGKLGGKIIKIGDYYLIIMDPAGTKWDVEVGEALYPKQKLNIDQFVHILGKKTGDATFKADKIVPWHIKPGVIKHLPLR